MRGESRIVTYRTVSSSGRLAEAVHAVVKGTCDSHWQRKLKSESKMRDSFFRITEILAPFYGVPLFDYDFR